jgi:hypothetical protein
MAGETLDQALTRAERGLARIERAVGDSSTIRRGDDALRSRVRSVIAELDRLISRAEA